MSHARTLRFAVPPALLAAALLAACAGPRRAAEGAGVAIGEASVRDPGSAAQGEKVTDADGSAAPGEAKAGARAAFAEGVRLRNAGDLAGAAVAFDRAFAADPSLAWAGYDAALVREAQGDLDGARVAYARTVDANPGFLPAGQAWVRLALRSNRAEDAEREIRARLEKAPEAAGLRNALAELALAAGKLDAAEEEARRALKADEKNVTAMVTLATVYERKRRFELSKMVLENARAVDDRDAAVWNRLGFVELALGNRAQAMECFKAAAGLRADYAEARANYGSMLADAEDYDAAVTELEAAVFNAPSSAPAWMGLGNAYRGQKRFEKAEAAYRRALGLDPSLVEIHYNLAVLYLDGEKPGLPTLARLEQALAFFDAYEAKGGAEPKIADYRKDAGRAVDREKKRLAREEKDRIRKEAEARKKAEQEQRDAEERARQEAALAEQRRAETAEAERKAAEEAARAAPAAGGAPALAPAAADAAVPAPAPRAVDTAAAPSTPGADAAPAAVPATSGEGAPVPAPAPAPAVEPAPADLPLKAG